MYVYICVYIMTAHFCYCLKNHFVGKTIHVTFMYLSWCKCVNEDTSFSDLYWPI